MNIISHSVLRRLIFAYKWELLYRAARCSSTEHFQIKLSSVQQLSGTTQEQMEGWRLNMKGSWETVKNIKVKQETHKKSHLAEKNKLWEIRCQQGTQPLQNLTWGTREDNSNVFTMEAWPEAFLGDLLLESVAFLSAELSVHHFSPESNQQVTEGFSFMTFMVPRGWVLLKFSFTSTVWFWLLTEI